MSIRERKESTSGTLLSRLFGLDLRSLALFRVAIAVVVLGDLADRARDIGAFYTDAGVLRRSDLLDTFPWLHEWPLCIHLAGGAWWTQGVVFLLHAVAALLLLLGYRTRLATFLVWLLTASVQLRNLYIGHGSDAQLRMMLFWGCFLPLGARYSIDSARRPLSRERASEQYVSVATIAALVQIICIYFGSGYAKWQQPPWREGTAVASVLNNDVWATSAGWFLLQYPTVCRWLTHVVVDLELLTPALLLMPVLIGPIRTLTVLALGGMHIGFALGLRVGMFQWVSIASLTCLLPGWFWEHVVARLETASGRWQPPSTGLGATAHRLGASLGVPLAPTASAPSSHASGRWRVAVREGLCAVFLVYVVFWNVGVVRDPAYEAPSWISWLGASCFLQQDWRMFAALASRTGALIIPGTLKDGMQVNLFDAGGPLPDLDRAHEAHAVTIEMGASTVHPIKNYRWRAFIDRLAFGKRGDQQLLQYGRYLCREWNHRHQGMEQLDSLQIYFVSRPVPPEYRPVVAQDYDKALLWTHWCFK